MRGWMPARVMTDVRGDVRLEIWSLRTLVEMDWFLLLLRVRTDLRNTNSRVGTNKQNRSLFHPKVLSLYTVPCACRGQCYTGGRVARGDSELQSSSPSVPAKRHPAEVPARCRQAFQWRLVLWICLRNLFFKCGQFVGKKALETYKQNLTRLCGPDVVCGPPSCNLCFRTDRLLVPDSEKGACPGLSFCFINNQSHHSILCLHGGISSPFCVPELCLMGKKSNKVSVYLFFMVTFTSAQ